MRTDILPLISINHQFSRPHKRKGTHVAEYRSYVSVGVARKYSVLTEIIDIFTQACKVCIHDEDVAETDFEHPFEISKEF